MQIIGCSLQLHVATWGIHRRRATPACRLQDAGDSVSEIDAAKKGPQLRKELGILLSKVFLHFCSERRTRGRLLLVEVRDRLPHSGVGCPEFSCGNIESIKADHFGVNAPRNFCGAWSFFVSH